MDARQLEYFLAVVDERSFTRGARRVHVVQSAVSSAIKALETELGVALIDRSNREVRPTEAGQAIIEPARAVMEALRAVREASAINEVTGAVRIGLLAAQDVLDLAMILTEFVKEHPAVNFSVSTSQHGTQGLVDGLLEESLDVSLMVLPATVPNTIEVETLVTGDVVFVVATDHPLASRASVTAREIAQYPFADFQKGFSVRSVSDDFFSSRGLSRSVIVEATNMELTIHYVRSGMVVGFVADFVAAADPALVAVPVDGFAGGWTVALAVKRNRRLSFAVRLLIDRIRAQAPVVQERVRQQTRGLLPKDEG
jgi:DNA-binding transcriptional LysR family regulator